MITYQNIKTATAIYTGGGIYIYYGQLTDDSYFRTCDDFDFISICDADTSSDDADYIEFYEVHEINTLINNNFKTAFNAILKWIINNRPSGNYSANELENRFIF